jgi:hypothetical protein
MGHISLYWILLVPVILSVIHYFVYTKYKFNIGNVWGTLAGGLAISLLIVSSIWFLGKGYQTKDVELLNGEIVSKSRLHDHYLRSYSCNCRQSCSGSGSSRSCSTTCDTCYEDRYTVTWNANSTVGVFTIDHLDWSSSTVYLTKDPSRYSIINVGDPACNTHSYVNWVKGARASLFNNVKSSDQEKYKNLIPQIPTVVYDFYRANRVISPNVAIPNQQEWNDNLAVVLKTLGPKKQANVIIVFVNADEGYFNVLKDSWLNGKKNDIVVVIGTENVDSKPNWVRIMSWAENDIFNVELRDELMALEKTSMKETLSTIETVTMKSFKRQSMKKYEYLESEIQPPTWLLILTVVLNILGYVGFWIYGNQYTSGSRYTSSRGYRH